MRVNKRQKTGLCARGLIPPLQSATQRKAAKFVVEEVEQSAFSHIAKPVVACNMSTTTHNALL